MKPKPHENPLIPHARMRGLFRALAEARLLGKRGGWPRNLEACWVATALDLRDGDLTSDSQASWLTDHVRALGKLKEARAANKSELRKVNAARERAVAFDGTPVDRLLCAIGQAMALKAAAQGVVIAYVESNGIKPADWKRVIAVSEGRDLPLIVVATPGGGERRLDALKIPVIPVDAGDPVALYRVAQESINRARTDGGLVIIECVDCGLDPIKLLGTQLLRKGICTQRWLAAIEPAFRTLK